MKITHGWKSPKGILNPVAIFPHKTSGFFQPSPGKVFFLWCFRCCHIFPPLAGHWFTPRIRKAAASQVGPPPLLPLCQLAGDCSSVLFFETHTLPLNSWQYPLATDPFSFLWHFLFAQILVGGPPRSNQRCWKTPSHPQLLQGTFFLTPIFLLFNKFGSLCTLDFPW